MKLVYFLIKRLCYIIFFIYSINVVFQFIGVYVPINLFSLGTGLLLGTPGVVSIIFLVLLI